MSKKTIKFLVVIPAVILVILTALYFLFPGTVFRILLNSERSSAGLEQKSIDVDNIHYEYLEGGKGEVLILLHGFGGNKDRVLHMSAAKKLESVMPNAKSIIMKNVGHVPMVEKPEDSANIFLSFLGKKQP